MVFKDRGSNPLPTELKRRNMVYEFKPLEVIDPITGQKKILSVKEQEELLEKGICLNPKSSQKIPSSKRIKNGK
jgi:hypothetical protein